MSALGKGIRRWATRLLVLVLLAGAGFGVYRLRGVHASVTLPNTAVRKGEFLVLVRCRGALRARKSIGIYAPMVPGLRISWLAPVGENVNAADVIVRFDSSSAQQQLAQKDAQLRQAQATLDQAVAQSKITAQQDATDLADAKFTVERARLQASQSEIVSRIQGEESRIDLGVAEQKLKVEEATVALHQAADRSKIASLTRQRDQAKFDVDITRERISQMELKAPSSGVLNLNTNCSGAFTSADCKPYKVGDNAFAGMSLGQIPDLNTLEMDAKLEEADRGKVALHQDVIVRVDALPELNIPAKVSEVSSLAEMRMEYPYTRSFRAYAAILQPDKRLRPEMNGGMDIIVKRIPNAISIPSRALFTRAGKPIVYLSDAGQYRAAEVEVLARNPDEVAISGIPASSTVALVDVSKLEQKK